MHCIGAGCFAAGWNFTIAKRTVMKADISQQCSATDGDLAAGRNSGGEVGLRFVSKG